MHVNNRTPSQKISKVRDSSVTGKSFEKQHMSQHCDFSTSSHNLDSSQIEALLVSRVGDNRPYVSIDIFGFKVSALLDSGASHSVIGEKGMHLVESSSVHVYETAIPDIGTAEGRRQKITGYVDLPVQIEDICKVVRFLLVPSICHTVILGSDFCKQFKLKIDFGIDQFFIGNKVIECRSRKPVEVSVLNRIHSEEELDEEQEQQLAAVKDKFKTLSWEAGEKLGRTNKVEHKINTGDAEPIKQRHHNMSPYMLAHLNAELDKMLKLGVVQPSTSPWASPVLLVKKSNGEMRFCFDGRKLNSLTKKDAYPLPLVDQILNKLNSAQFLSSIDLKAAFWQIPLEKDSCEKTAFVVPGRGLFEFNVLPFGLNNAAQTQQRLMDSVLGPAFEPYVFTFLDDVIVATPTFSKHIEVLEQIYEKFREANLTINIEKCEFCKPSLKYLGFVIDRQGLRTDPDKVAAMLNYPLPQTVTQVKRFIGVCGWYRRFLANFATMTAPITAMIKGKRKHQTISWTKEAKESFDKIKEALVAAPVLATPNFDKTFCIQSDASEVGLGSVLVQEDDEGREVPVAFASRTLTPQERKYTVTEKECLAVLYGIEKFRSYIEGVKFRVITDHYSLLWLNRLRDPCGRLARWAMKIQQYDMKIEHRKGSLNTVPDALSRAPLVHEVSLLQLDIKKCLEDPLFKKISDEVTKDPESTEWSVQNGLLYRYFSAVSPGATGPEWKLFIPKCYRQAVMKECHDDPSSAHLGIYKTLHRIQERYYWPRMRYDVKKYVRSCEVCLAQKTPTIARPGFMGKPKQASYPFQIISADLMGPFPRSSTGHVYLLVVADWFSKFVILEPLRQATAKSIAKFVEERVILYFGSPQIIICDNGTQFKSSLFQNLAARYGSKLWYNCKYHAQVNPVERVNRVVGAAIRSYLQKQNHKKWTQNISQIGFALRSSVHEVTGYTPNFLNFGRHVPLNGEIYGKLSKLNEFNLNPYQRDQYANNIDKLSDLQKEIQQKLDEAYRKNCHSYNTRKRETDCYQKGEILWKKNYVLSDASKQLMAKLEPKYVKCKVAEVISPLVYKLEDMNGKDLGRWHVKDLKRTYNQPANPV